MGVTTGVARRASLRAAGWLAAGVVAYAVAESVVSRSLEDPLPEGGWAELGVSAAMFIPIEMAGLLIAATVFAAFVAVGAALILWRGYSIAPATPARFAYLGAWMFAASWPLEAVFLFVRGNHVPGSPSGFATSVFVASLLAIEGATLWLTWRERRASREGA